MITLQHVAVFVMAQKEKCNSRREFEEKLMTSIPWLLLPDAIRAYTGPRQTSHFEESPDGTDISYMEFPSDEVLCELSKENANELIKSHLASSIPQCVIGESSNLQMFDRKNYAHQHYHTLRMHLVQDYILDTILRDDLVDVTERFNDCFTVKHNRSIKLTGAELRQQIMLFEQLGFMYLAGKVYKKTGLLLNQEWYDRNVHNALLSSVYPEDLAEKTYKYMKIPEDINTRISNLDFELTEADKKRVIMAEDLKETLDELYSAACHYSWLEL